MNEILVVTGNLVALSHSLVFLTKESLSNLFLCVDGCGLLAAVSE